MPTIRTSEFTVLQIVGLDAAVVSTPQHLRNTVLSWLAAPQFLQDVILSLFRLLHVRYWNPHADKLEGTSLTYLTFI